MKLFKTLFINYFLLFIFLIGFTTYSNTQESLYELFLMEIKEGIKTLTVLYAIELKKKKISIFFTDPKVRNLLKIRDDTMRYTS